MPDSPRAECPRCHSQDWTIYSPERADQEVLGQEENKFRTPYVAQVELLNHGGLTLVLRRCDDCGYLWGTKTVLE